MTCMMFPMRPCLCYSMQPLGGSRVTQAWLGEGGLPFSLPAPQLLSQVSVIPTSHPHQTKEAMQL